MERNQSSPVSNKGTKIIPRFIYYSIILFLTLSCAQTKQSKTKSEILDWNEKIKPSLTYSVTFVSLTRSFDPTYSTAMFTFDEHQICDKIFEILSKSDLFSLQSLKVYPTVNKGKTVLEENIADYHFSINIGWDQFTFGDEFLDACKSGWIAGSFGLFPWTESAEIEMDIHIISQGAHKKHYSYKKPTVNLCWGPTLLLKYIRKNEEYKYIDPEQFTSKIGEMMNEFLNEFSNEVFSK